MFFCLHFYSFPSSATVRSRWCESGCVSPPCNIVWLTSASKWALHCDFQGLHGLCSASSLSLPYTTLSLNHHPPAIKFLEFLPLSMSFLELFKWLIILQVLVLWIYLFGKPPSHNYIQRRSVLSGLPSTSFPGSAF